MLLPNGAHGPAQSPHRDENPSQAHTGQASTGFWFDRDSRDRAAHTTPEGAAIIPETQATADPSSAEETPHEDFMRISHTLLLSKPQPDGPGHMFTDTEAATSNRPPRAVPPRLSTMTTATGRPHLTRPIQTTRILLRNTTPTPAVLPQNLPTSRRFQPANDPPRHPANCLRLRSNVCAARYTTFLYG